MFRSLSNLITGFRSDSVMEREMKKSMVNGKMVTIVPGIRLEDQKGYECARKCGWIMNYQTLVELVDNDNFSWDLKVAEASEVMFKHFTTAILRLHAERKNAKVKMDMEKRSQVVGQLFGQLLGSTGLTQDSLSITGFLVLRFKHEVPCVPKAVVDEAIAKYVSKGVMPPVIVTHQAVEYLSRQHNLLNLEKNNMDGSIVFMPEVEKVTHSTALEEDLDTTCNDLADQISEIEFDLDANRGDITSFLEKTVVDMTDPDSLADVLLTLNQTHTKQRQLVVAVNNQCAQIDYAKEAIETRFVDQTNEINELQQIVHDKQDVIKTKENEIEDLEHQIATVKLEYNTKVASLNSELSVLEAHMAQERTKGVHVPVETLDDAEDKINSLETEAKLNKQKVQQNIAKIKKEHEATLTDKESQIEMLTRQKDAFSVELKLKVQQIGELTTELGEIENENSRLKQRNDGLDARMKKLNQKMKQMSALGKAAQQSTMDISTGPKLTKFKRQTAINQVDDVKLKRQTAVDEADDVKINPSDIKPSDVLSLLAARTEQPSFLANNTAIVATTMSTKEATNIVPRWTAQDNIVAYCKKVENAWKICQADGLTEEKFCQILRLQLPEAAAQVFDNLNESNMKVVAEIKKALLSHLDRQENDYLQEFASVQKEPSENHNTYALRVQRLYVMGTGENSTGGNSVSARDKKLIVEAFLKGLPRSEQSALRLVATDDEMQDVNALAKRASRSARTQTAVNAVALDQKNTLPDKQELTKYRFRGECFYCKKIGHSWRRCYKRANTEREWKPSESDMKSEPDKKEIKSQ